MKTFDLTEKTMVFNGMLFDTVNEALRDFDDQHDLLAVEHMRRVLGYIRDKMANADMVSRNE